MKILWFGEEYNERSKYLSTLSDGEFLGQQE
jgi:hypothetical protein